MAERLKAGEFTPGELNSLTKMRESASPGALNDAIEFEPDKADFLAALEAFRISPETAVPSSVEEPFELTARIQELVSGLDQRIMTHPRRTPRYREAFGVNGMKTSEGKWVNFSRFISEGQLNILVEHIIEPEGIYPFIQSEKFALSEDGMFIKMLYERYSPTEPCRSNAVIGFKPGRDQYHVQAAIELGYFRGLIAPFLEGSEVTLAGREDSGKE